MTIASNFGQDLLAAIASRDAQKSLSMVQQFTEYMRDKTAGVDFVNWITEPVNLTSVHRALAENLEVPQRLLAIKRVPMTRTTKAVLLVKAIEIAIKKVHKL